MTFVGSLVTAWDLFHRFGVTKRRLGILLLSVLSHVRVVDRRVRYGTPTTPRFCVHLWDELVRDR